MASNAILVVKQFKEISKKEIGEISEKVEGKIHQPS